MYSRPDSQTEWGYSTVRVSADLEGDGGVDGAEHEPRQQEALADGHDVQPLPLRPGEEAGGLSEPRWQR